MIDFFYLDQASKYRLLKTNLVKWLLTAEIGEEFVVKTKNHNFKLEYKGLESNDTEFNRL